MQTTIKEVKKYFIFEDEKEYTFIVDDFKDGFVIAEIPISVNISENTICLSLGIERYAAFIAGCFERNSNFKQEIFKVFECSEDTQFLGFILYKGDFSCKLSVYDNSSSFIIFDILCVVVDVFAWASEDS